MPIVIPYAFLGSFLATVFVLQWDIRTSYPAWIFGMLGLVVVFGIFLYRKNIILIAASLGITLALFSVSHAADRGQFADLQTIVGQKNIELIGTVIGQPDDRGTNVQFIITTTHARSTQTGSFYPIHANILATSRRQEAIPQPGDIVEIRGRLIRAEASSRYERYLRMRNIGAVIEMHSIRTSGASPSNTMYTHLHRWLWRIKQQFQDHLHTVMPEPMAGLLDGLLTGNNGGLTASIQEDFRLTGLSHIVAVSGSNITVILSVLSRILFFIPQRKRFIPCVIGIILFTIFVGASASVVRATIMGIIGLIALQTEQQRHARLAMLWTAFCMLCWNPWQLWADAGFQLSFLAVIGLIEFTPLLQPWLRHIPTTGGIQEALIATLAAQITAVPWGVLLFGAIPVISPLSNSIVAPLIPLGMSVGAIALLIGYIMPPLAGVIGFPAALILDAIIQIANILARIPGASLQVPAISSWLMAIYYACLVLLLYIVQHHPTNDTKAL